MATETDYAGNGTFAFVAGLLIGAGGALLLAPTSGRETRERLRGYAQQTKDRLSRLVEKTGEEAQKVAEKGQEFVQENTARVKEAFHSGREALRS